MDDFMDIPIQIELDGNGFAGRECPNPDCEGYFKVVSGTGLTGDNLPCHCPYCGRTAPHEQFWTKDQAKRIESTLLNTVGQRFHKSLKKLESEFIKVTPGRPLPIHRYQEKQLETEVLCGQCTLRYAVYGVFAFCPDCGQHNSLDILNKNMSAIEKMLALAKTLASELAVRLTEDGLMRCVSAFDGYGRELCRLRASKATDPSEATKVSFQNLEGARQNLLMLFNVDLAAGVTGNEWAGAIRCFQRRHLLSHKEGVVDEEYIRKSGDSAAVVGHRIAVDEKEVRNLVATIRKLAHYIHGCL